MHPIRDQGIVYLYRWDRATNLVQVEELNKYRVDFGLFQEVRRLKPDQLLVIQTIAQGKDMFAELPTGFGKSLTFQVGCYVDACPV